MLRLAARLGTALSLAIIATALVFWWRNASATQRQMAALQEQKHELERVVTRLNTESRVADVIVTDQSTRDGQTDTKLLFVEYDRAGQAMPPREFGVRGKQVHIDAEVIEFEQDYVMKGDPLRGHAVALFTRLYGDDQPPSAAAAIDPPGDVPGFYRDDASPVTAFEADLWKQFWQLQGDTELQKKSGVKVAVGKGVWGPFEPGQLYTITLGADGNLSRRVEPIRGVYGSYIKLLQGHRGTPAAN